MICLPINDFRFRIADFGFNSAIHNLKSAIEINISLSGRIVKIFLRICYGKRETGRLRKFLDLLALYQNDSGPAPPSVGTGAGRQGCLPLFISRNWRCMEVKCHHRKREAYICHAFVLILSHDVYQELGSSITSWFAESRTDGSFSF
jgi:hypothetical protein